MTDNSSPKKKIINLQYLDFGKYFIKSVGASDYVMLAQSDNFPSLQVNHLRHLIKATDFHKQVGNVDVAFILQSNTENFFLIQVQYRKEDELDSMARMKRLFKQHRLIFLDKKQILTLFRDGAFPYLQLLLQNYKKTEPERFQLKTYTKMDGVISHSISLTQSIDGSESDIPYLWRCKFDTIFMNTSTQFKLVENSAKILAKRQKVVITNKLSLLEKLLIVQAVQMILFCKLELITFATDYVTDHPVNLLFLSPEQLTSKIKNEYFVVHEIMKFDREDDWVSKRIKKIVQLNNWGLMSDYAMRSDENM